MDPRPSFNSFRSYSSNLSTRSTSPSRAPHAPFRSLSPASNRSNGHRLPSGQGSMLPPPTSKNVIQPPYRKSPLSFEASGSSLHTTAETRGIPYSNHDPRQSRPSIGQASYAHSNAPSTSSSHRLTSSVSRFLPFKSRKRSVVETFPEAAHGSAEAIAPGLAHTPELASQPRLKKQKSGSFWKRNATNLDVGNLSMSTNQNLDNRILDDDKALPYQSLSNSISPRKSGTFWRRRNSASWNSISHGHPYQSNDETRHVPVQPLGSRDNEMDLNEFGAIQSYTQTREEQEFTPQETRDDLSEENLRARSISPPPQLSMDLDIGCDLGLDQNFLNKLSGWS